MRRGGRRIGGARRYAPTRNGMHVVPDSRARREREVIVLVVARMHDIVDPPARASSSSSSPVISIPAASPHRALREKDAPCS
jgi:hypothetical protein